MAWRLRLARDKKSPAKDSEATVSAAPTPAPPQRESPPNSTDTERPPPKRTVATRGAGIAIDSLRQKLLDMYGERVPRDAFATQAIQLMHTAVGAVAAAFLAYDKRRDRLVLVAAIGLSDDACEALGGGPGVPGWEIPLRGLANRRISVIEAAHQNPFVPRPLVEVSPRRLTIASLPFFHGFTPVGVLVLFADKPHAFGDTQLQAVGQALKVCGLAFAELPRSAESSSVVAGRVTAGAPEAATHPTDANAERQHAADAQEIARLRTAFDEALWQHAKELAETRRAASETLQVERAEVAALGAKLAEAVEERDRFATQLAQIRAELATLSDTRDALDMRSAEATRLNEALTKATAELERTTLRLAELQRTHADLVVASDTAQRQHAEQARNHSGERERDAATIAVLRQRIEELDSDHARLRKASEALQAAHDRLRDQLGTVQERAATLESQVHETAAARAALAAELTELRAAADAASQHATDADHTAARLRQQLAEQTAALSSERDALRRELAHAAAAADDLRATLAVMRAERDAGTANASAGAQRLAQLEEQLTRIRAEHAADASTAQQEREQLVAELEHWRERELAWTANLAQARAQAEAIATERTRLADALATLEQSHGRSVDQTSRQLRTAEQALETLRGQHRELEHRYTALETAAVAVQAERDQLSTLYGNLRAEHQQGVARWDDDLKTRDRQIAALQAQLDTAQTQHQSVVGETSSQAKRLKKERDAAEAARKQAEQALADHAARLQAIEKELATTAATQAATQLELTQTATRYERDAAELRRQLADAQTALEAARREHQSTAAEHAASAETVVGLQQDLATLRAELESAADTLSRQRRESESTRTELSGAAQRLTKYEDDLAALRAQLNEQLASAERERGTHREEIVRLTAEWESERTALQNRSEELEHEIAQSRSEHLRLAEALAADDGEPALEIERHVIPGVDDSAADLAADRVEPVETVSNTVAVVDGELGPAMVTELTHAGFDAVACEPTEAAVDQLVGESLGAVAINVLAGTNGWQLVRHLRSQAATSSVPLLLYAKLNDANGFYFGPADCVLWPSEPQRLLDALARLKPRAKRVLAMSTDIDIVATVREQLTGAGLSAAVMLDGKQALDLLPSVRPDAVVLHVSPACNDVFRTIAGLRAANGAAPLPIVFLLDREPTARDATFLVGGARTLVNKGTFGGPTLIEALTPMLPATNAPAAEGPVRARVRPAETLASDGWVG